MTVRRLAGIIAIVLALLGAGGETLSVDTARNLVDPTEHCATDPAAGMSLFANVARRGEASADNPLKPSLCIPQSVAANPSGRHIRMALASGRAVPPDSPVSLHTLLSD